MVERITQKAKMVINKLIKIYCLICSEILKSSYGGG